MQFQVTQIEFDFDDEYGPYPEEDKQGVINQTMTTIWEAYGEDDLIEEITCATGWALNLLTIATFSNEHNNSNLSNSGKN